MRPAALMLQGTGSDVGKSLLAAGLGRAYTRRGLAVRPFKPQNMSNNAAVTAEGGEIGRAQALQARACGVAPSIHMNPVLLKPQTEVGAQVVVQGRVSYRQISPIKSEPQLIVTAQDRITGRMPIVLPLSPIGRHHLRNPGLGKFLGWHVPGRPGTSAYRTGRARARTASNGASPT